MPTYEYRCRVCADDVEYLVVAPEPPAEAPPCPGIHPRGYECHRLKRVFSFQTPPASIQFGYEGYDPATGTHVTSRRDQSEKLKVLSEQQTLRTGVVHDYRPVHPADKLIHEPTEEGLDSTYANARATGLSERKTVYL